MRLGDQEKTPADVLDFPIDAGRWLPSGDYITNATATITDSTAVVDQVVYANTSLQVWISGGADAELGEVDVTITTHGGRTKKVCFRLRIRDC